MTAGRLLLATLLLLALPLAAAQPISGSFESAGSTHMDGDLRIEWQGAGMFLLPPEGTTLAFDLQDARLDHVDIPRERNVVNLTGQPQVVEAGREETHLWSGAGAGRLTFTADALSNVRLLPVDGPLRSTTRGEAAEVRAAGTPWTDPANRPLDGLGYVADAYIRPTSTRAHTLATATVPGAGIDLDGPVVLALAGGVAHWSGLELQTGWERDQERTVYDEGTDSGRIVDHDRILIVRAQRLTLHAPALDWSLAAYRVDAAVEGGIEWRGLHGAPDLEGRDLRPDPEVLRVEGDLRTNAELDAPARTTWVLAGDASRVQVDRAPFSATGTAVAATALVGLLLLEPARVALAELLGRLVPLRLHTRDGEDARRRILAHLHQHQPVLMRELGDATGLARSTLRYHLRILQRQGVLESHAPGGRNRTYMLNGGSLRFRAETTSPVDTDGTVATVAAHEALSVAHGHPSRRLLVERLLEGSADQDDLREHLAAAGRPVARSTLSHHLRLLEEAGVVVGRFQDGRKHYLPNLDLDAVRLEQYRRYFTGHGLLALVTALAHRELDEDAARRLLQTVPGAPTVDHLLDVAVLERRDGRVRLTASLRGLARRLRGSAS